MTVLHKNKNFHLRKASSAGIIHVHLLPIFQFAGVDDQKENWRNVGKI
jgi:pullulanase/glycogen debranching enzyme